MSRSYRKGVQCCGDKTFKKIFNRRLRRSQKCENIPSGSAYKKFNQTWLIADYRYSISSWEDFKTWPWVYDKEKDKWDPYNYGNFSSEKGAYAYWKRHYLSK